MRTKKRRKSLDERLLEARASAGSGRSEARRPSAPPPLEEAHEPAVAPAPPLEIRTRRRRDTRGRNTRGRSPRGRSHRQQGHRRDRRPRRNPRATDGPAGARGHRTPEIDTPAPGFDAAARFDTAEQGVDEVARAVAALSASEGDTFLPSGAAMPAVPIAPPVRPAVPQPEPDAGFTASAADGSGLFAAAFSETTSPALPATREAAPEREAPSAAVAEASELPTGLMDRWNLTTRRARKATSFPVPTLEPEPPAIVAEPEEQSVAVTTLHRVVEVDEIIPVATAEPETPTEDAADEFEGRAQQHPRGGQFGRVGATMIERGLISEEQLSRGARYAAQLRAARRRDPRRVGRADFGRAGPRARRPPRRSSSRTFAPSRPTRSSRRFLPEEVARRYDALAIARSERSPRHRDGESDATSSRSTTSRLVTGQPLIAAMAVKEDLRAAIDRVYRGSIVETTLDAADERLQVDRRRDRSQPGARGRRGTDRRLVDALMSQAITDHASDLHIEPCSTHIAVRFRIDGVLHDSSRGSPRAPAAVGEPREDPGRPRHRAEPHRARRTVLAHDPGAIGRRARRHDADRRGRIRDPAPARPDARHARRVEPRAQRRPSTRASFPRSTDRKARCSSWGRPARARPRRCTRCSRRSTRRSKSIISVEDPVEFRLDGVKQMQINPRVGLTFPTTLPSVLRADPDIVFIGEVRDSETARIAADASITGHLVLSTIARDARRGHADATHRDGCRAVPRRVGAHARRVATTRAQALRTLRGSRRRRASTICGSSAPTTHSSTTQRFAARSVVRPAATPATGAGSRSSRSCRSPSASAASSSTAHRDPRSNASRSTKAWTRSTAPRCGASRAATSASKRCSASSPDFERDLLGNALGATARWG